MSALRIAPSILALTCIAVAQPASAQTVNPGARVRVVDVASGQPMIIGDLVRQSGDTVFVTPAVRAPILLETSRRLEVRTGVRRHTVRGMGIGLLVGAGVGAALGFAVNDPTGCGYSPWYPGSCASISRGGAAMMGGTLGGTLGMMIGALAGALTTTESWRPVRPVRLAAAPTIGRGVRLTATISF